MNNKKISVVIITFFLFINAVHIYSGTAIVSNTAVNAVKSVKNSKSDIINTSSFKQISKRVYDVCSKVYVDIQNDMFYFTAGVQKDASIKRHYKVVVFSKKPLEYAFGGSGVLAFNSKTCYLHAKNIFKNTEGFNALFVFVISMFMLFLCALYKGSVPNSAFIINNNFKTRYL